MTRRLKRILIAINDGQTDREVVETAIDLAADEGAEVIFVHVVGIPGEGYLSTDRIARVPAPATTELLASLCEEARGRGLEASSELLIGYPPRQIALLADDRDADLIVVGSRRLSAIRRAMLGSTSRALLVESSRRVLVVPLTAGARAEELAPA